MTQVKEAIKTEIMKYLWIKIPVCVYWNIYK